MASTLKPASKPTATSAQTAAKPAPARRAAPSAAAKAGVKNPAKPSVKALAKAPPKAPAKSSSAKAPQKATAKAPAKAAPQSKSAPSAVNQPTPAPTPTDAQPDQRRAQGRAQRQQTPRRALAQCPAADAPQRQPLAWLAASNQGRIAELAPLRLQRMQDSALAFYRGAAVIMARDLAALPHSGVMAQLCGDCHLSNFGFFASPERELVFDLNDFDETIIGPFDWDLRRLAASFEIAARDRDFKPAAGSQAVRSLLTSYRTHINRFAAMGPLPTWYYRLTARTLLDLEGGDKTEIAVIRKARRNTAERFAHKATVPDAQGRLTIRDEPPYVYHDQDLTRREMGDFMRGFDGFWQTYCQSLAPERRALLSRFAVQDVAVLTPGVGSVGLRCFIVLLVADGGQPLFLQCKQAAASVWHSPAGAAAAPAKPARGQQVVQSQRLLQSASDIFLGWASDDAGRSYYVRQLRDMKGGFDVAQFSPKDLSEYAQACGYALARAHAKGGDAHAIGGYLGRSAGLMDALVAFARSYAEVNQADWQRLRHSLRGHKAHG